MKCPNCQDEMIVLDEFSDWDGYEAIYGCPSCRRLWLFQRKLASSTTQLLRGEIEWRHALKPYTEKYVSYPEMKQRLEEIIQNP